MKNEQVSYFEIGILMTYLLKSFILINGINVLIKNSMNDLVICSIIGIIVGYLFILLFGIKGKNDIFSVLSNSFVKPLAIILKLILIITVILFSSYLLYTISMFIKASLLNNVDVLPISILLCLSIVYLVKKGISSICKTSLICIGIFILLELITIVFLLPNVNSLNLLPLFSNSGSNIIKNSALYLLLSITPVFLLSCINIKTSDKNKKYIKVCYFIASIYNIFNIILLLSVVDVKLANIIEYPELFILSKISFLKFFDRLEGILSFKLIFDSFFTLSLAFFYIEKGLNTTIKKQTYSKVIFYISIIIILFLTNYLKFNNLFIINCLFIFLLLNLFINLFIQIFKQRTKTL